MIIAVLLKPFWLFVAWLAGLEFNVFTTIPAWYPYFRNLAKVGLSVFPLDVWVIVLGNIVFWLGVHLAGAVIEWIYKKIPGVS